MPNKRYKSIFFLFIHIINLGDNMGNMTETVLMIPRSLFSLIILFLITKIIGKKQVSELSLFDYVIGISIGNFAAEMTINMDVPYIYGIIAVLVFGFSAYTVSKVTMKSMILRRWIIGKPTMIIQNGKILEKSLKKVMIDVNDLLEQCRSAGYFDLNEIDYAIMEANGKMSFLPNSEYKPLTPKDMKIKTNKASLCANVIIDGKIMYQNLENANKTEEWLKKELKVKGYSDMSDILLATLDNQEKLTIYERNCNLKIDNVLE